MGCALGLPKGLRILSLSCVCKLHVYLTFSWRVVWRGWGVVWRRWALGRCSAALGGTGMLFDSLGLGVLFGGARDFRWQGWASFCQSCLAALAGRWAALGRYLAAWGHCLAVLAWVVAALVCGLKARACRLAALWSCLALLGCCLAVPCAIVWRWGVV